MRSHIDTFGEARSAARGFQVSYENGYTLSVLMGAGHPTRPGSCVEIAVWDSRGQNLLLSEDNTIRWVSVSELPDVMREVERHDDDEIGLLARTLGCYGVDG